MAFVGRDVELAQLARALQRASEGETSRVVLAGPAGIGVSAVIDELASRLAGMDGVVVARGRAVEPLHGQPYAAVADALDGVLSTLPDERLAAAAGPAAHDLLALLPALEGRLDAAGVAHGPPSLAPGDQIGNRVLEAIIGTVERLASDGLVLLVLEDLHWSDPATRALVEALFSQVRPMRLCIVLAYQPEELHRGHPARALLEAVSSSAEVERIEIDHLSRDEMTRLAQGSGDGDRLSASFVAAVMEGSGGNPLRATQLIAAHQVLDGLRLSDPFEEVLGARLDAFTPGAVRALRLLAAARRALPLPVCLSVSLHDGRLDKRALDEAVASGLAVDDGFGRLGIAHDLYAEAIEALSVPPERHAIHAALAAAPSMGPAEAAWHWSAAARPDDARLAHLSAAQAAERLDPGASALFHYHAALELAGPATDTPEGAAAFASTLVSAGRAAAATGSFRRAAGLVKRAIDVQPARSRRSLDATDRSAAKAEQRLVRARQGELHERLGRYRWAGGDLVGGIQEMRRAVELIPAEPDEARASALATLAQHLMLQGAFEESAAIAHEACETARAARPEAIARLGHATCTMGVDLAYLGDLDGGLRLVEEATDIARKAGRADDLMRAYANRTTLLDLDSRRERALQVVNDGIRDAREAGLGDTYGAFLRGNAADILFSLGQWPASEVECRAGMAYRPAGVAWFSPILYLGLVLVESRADDEATRLVGQTLLQLEQVPAGQWTALVLRSAVSLLLWRGEPADAVQVAAREWPKVLETADALQIAVAASTALEAAAALAETGRQQRDLAAVAAANELASRALGDAEGQVEASGMAPSLGARREAELHLETARAHLARSRGRSSAAHWSTLADAWSASGLPYQQAKARWWQALALLQGGSGGDGRRAAKDPLLEAWRIAMELPAGPLRRALADLARRARIQLPGVAPADLAPIPTPPLARPWPSDGALLPEEGRAEGGGRSRSGEGAGADRPLVAVGPGLHVADGESPSIEDRVGGRDDSADGAFGLSAREREVLLVLTEGRTNREIAERLFISERTVGVHVRHILAKLGVATRTQAAATAIRRGLVDDIEPPGSSAASGGR